MAVPNIFGSATAAIPLSQLDTNFATPVTIGNTAVQLGNTVTSFGNVTLTNVTISSGNVTVSAGSNTAPSITTVGDTNTGIFFPAADTIAFSEGGAEVARFDSSGNLGVGITTPVSPLTAARGNVTGAGQWASSAIAVYNPTNTGSYSQISFGYTTGTTNAAAYIGYVSTNQGTNGYGDLVFGTRAVNTDTQPTERARITSAGEFLVGATSKTGSGASEGKQVIRFAGATENGLYLDDTRTSAGGDTAVVFGRGATGVGQIATTLTATSYATSSDYRLKENVAPMTGALEKVLELNPVTYTWKVDGSDGQGFIAHELQEVAPYAVSGEKDGEEMQGVDYGKITPLLTAALQKAIAKIETLEARIAALEEK